MKTITAIMKQDHTRCDDLFVKAEESACIEEWDKAAACFTDFHDAIERHFRMEEEVLFPDFEEKTNSIAGPTAMMRSEHTQMRDLFVRMSQALESNNLDDYLGHSETLLIIMQQHNAKEEQILYPMTDQALGGDVERVISAIENIT